MPVNHAALAPTIIALWHRRGPDTLVKVMPIGTLPDPTRRIGDCTTLRYVVGRTPAEMEAVLARTGGAPLAGGVSVYTVDPLPRADEFALRGYGAEVGLPGETAGAVSHPLYPAGLGAPTWDLAGVPQSHLVLIARVQQGEPFAFEVRRLAPLR